MTTFEPGASDVFTHGRRVRPRATALRASRPAPSITDGFEVFVQLVIAAITTSPWSSANASPSHVTSTAVRERSATAAPAATAGACTGPAGRSSWPGELSAAGALAGDGSATPPAWAAAR